MGEILALQAEQVVQRKQYKGQRPSEAFAVKTVGINQGEWGSLNLRKKLRPSQKLLDIDRRYMAAMDSHRYAMAQELKARYEAQAHQEWQEQMHKDEAQWRARGAKLEADHQQQMKALQIRHRSARNNLHIKEEK